MIGDIYETTEPISARERGTNNHEYFEETFRFVILNEFLYRATIMKINTGKIYEVLLFDNVTKVA